MSSPAMRDRVGSMPTRAVIWAGVHISLKIPKVHRALKLLRAGLVAPSFIDRP
jgi:hypothetical protein